MRISRMRFSHIGGRKEEECRMRDKGRYKREERGERRKEGERREQRKDYWRNK